MQPSRLWYRKESGKFYKIINIGVECGDIEQKRDEKAKVLIPGCFLKVSSLLTASQNPAE
jgi:hypothetical protein